MRALEDLTYDKRKDFISKHKLPVDELPVISFHTEASTAPTVLATLTRIAQAELLPWLPLPRFFLSASEFVESMLASLKVPVVAPVSGSDGGHRAPPATAVRREERRAGDSA